ncbi:hypothetical protein BSKO_13925 [Bryopsis sp. KO-2023]|nr:hypothetical protein BSKO_13925 [Bryopsis sp. KO-2023]
MPRSNFIHESTLPAAPARALAGLPHPKGSKKKAIAIVARSGRSREAKTGPYIEGRNPVQPNVLGDDVRRTIVDAESFIGKLKERSFVKPTPVLRSIEKKPISLVQDDANPPNPPPSHSNLDHVTKAFQHRLSHQLESLNRITKTLRSDRGSIASSTSLIKTNCKHFIVGKLTSQSNSTTEFFSDRVEFYFHHPNQGKIQMVMFYRDMQDIHVFRARKVLQFKIVRRLHLFGKDYEHLNPMDILSMEFGSQADMMEFCDRGLDVMNHCSL